MWNSKKITAHSLGSKNNSGQIKRETKMEFILLYCQNCDLINHFLFRFFALSRISYKPMERKKKRILLFIYLGSSSQYKIPHTRKAYKKLSMNIQLKPDRISPDFVASNQRIDVFELHIIDELADFEVVYF